MADNFRGVLIFVIIVVDWQSRKFTPTKINVYRYEYIRGAWPKTSWKHGHLFSVASSTLIFFHLMLFVQVSFAEVAQ